MVSDEFWAAAMGFPKDWIRRALREHLAEGSHVDRRLSQATSRSSAVLADGLRLRAAREYDAPPLYRRVTARALVFTHHATRGSEHLCE